MLVVAERLGLSPGSYGGVARTPHLDRLAKRGRLFEQAFAAHPSAGPSRATLLTGLEPSDTGVWYDEARETIADAAALPERLRADGYFAAHVDKILGGAAEAAIQWDAAEDPGAAGSLPGASPAGLAENR